MKSCLLWLIIVWNDDHTFLLLDKKNFLNFQFQNVFGDSGKLPESIQRCFHVTNFKENTEIIPQSSQSYNLLEKSQPNEKTAAGIPSNRVENRNSKSKFYDTKPQLAQITSHKLPTSRFLEQQNRNLAVITVIVVITKKVERKRNNFLWKTLALERWISNFQIPMTIEVINTTNQNASKTAKNHVILVMDLTKTGMKILVIVTEIKNEIILLEWKSQ